MELFKKIRSKGTGRRFFKKNHCIPRPSTRSHRLTHELYHSFDEVMSESHGDPVFRDTVQYKLSTVSRESEKDRIPWQILYIFSLAESAVNV